MYLWLQTISQPHSVPADSHVIQLDVINEYNPLLPNDYDEYCQEREAAKLREEQQREEEERARQLRKGATCCNGTTCGRSFPLRSCNQDMERMQRERSKTGTGAKTEHLQISSGEEAFLRRARMSGQSVPATSAPPPPQAPANPLEAVARRKRMRPSSCGCIVMLLVSSLLVACTFVVAHAVTACRTWWGVERWMLSWKGRLPKNVISMARSYRVSFLRIRTRPFPSQKSCASWWNSTRSQVLAQVGLW